MSERLSARDLKTLEKISGVIRNIWIAVVETHDGSIEIDSVYSQKIKEETERLTKLNKKLLTEEDIVTGYIQDYYELVKEIMPAIIRTESGKERDAIKIAFIYSSYDMLKIICKIYNNMFFDGTGNMFNYYAFYTFRGV